MVSAVVAPEFVCVSEHFVLRQVVGAFAAFAQSLAQFLAHVAKVVVLAVVHIKAVRVVEVVVFAEKAARVLLLNVPIQLFVAKDALLKHKHGFRLKTQFAQVDFVHAHIVFAQLKQLPKFRVLLLLPLLSPLSCLPFAVQTVKPNFALNFGADVLARVNNALFGVFNPTGSPFGYLVVGVVCDEHSLAFFLAGGAPFDV